MMLFCAHIIGVYPISLYIYIYIYIYTFLFFYFFLDSINYARKYIDVTNEQYEIILACRKTVIKNNDSTWVKNGLENFDVPMGGYDSSHYSRPCRFIYIK